MKQYSYLKNMKSLHSTTYGVISGFVIPLMVAMCMLLCAFSFSSPKAAENFVVEKYDKNLVGYVKVEENSHLNLREGPGTTYNVVRTLDYGTIFQATGEVVNDKGEVWYQVWVANSLSKITGYISSAYAGFVAPEDDVEFENSMIAKGFPESYRDYLRILHKFYPNWTFDPLITNLDWEEVIDNETVFNRNNVYMPSPSSWKSLSEGSFDWLNNKWVGTTGSMWTNASEEIVRYYMDPRNFLNTSQFFQMELLSYNEKVHTVEGVELVLKGTFMHKANVPLGDENGEPITYAELFVEVGALQNASPYMLAARVRQEQGVNGTNKLISGTVSGYEGYYNYFNIKASGSTDAEILKNGLNEAVSNGWTSPYLAIKGGAATLVSGHISKGQDTLYLQKFDVDNKYFGLYWHQYMQNIQAPTSESRSVLNTYTSLGLLNSAIAFKIPVYENMPELAAECPLGDGNPNYRLSSLTVEGFSINPSFDHGTFSYTLSVDSSVESINVSALPIADTSTVSGCGTVMLLPGENIIELLCVSERGDSGVYKLVVYRETGGLLPEETTEVPSLTPSVTDVPTSSVTASPTATPTPKPTATPTPKPTATPTPKPTATPTPKPTATPTPKPTATPTPRPTATPTPKPTATPTPTATPVVPSYTINYNLSDSSTLGKTILSGINEGMKVSDFNKGITVQNCTIEVCDSKGTVLKKDSIVKTGDVVKIKSGSKVIYECTIILYGDVTCDGKINALDFVYIKRHVWNISSLEGAAFEAAEVGKKDGNVNGLDFVYIKRHVWKIAYIVQK